LTLCDTSGDEDYDRLRPLSYINSDLIVLAFAMDDPDSIKSVINRDASQPASQIRFFLI
jgi:GTPase SAR1 family protein